MAVDAIEAPAAAEPFVVNALGVYDDMDDTVYHAQRTFLSSTGARKLLPPSTPAHFKHWRDSGEDHKPAFDFGHAAHLLVLGRGPELYVVDNDNWRKKSTQQERAAAYADGAVPLLPEEFDQVQAMAAALRQHPGARELFSEGIPERSVFWADPATGVRCRARLDWSRPYQLVDYKTTAGSAAPSAVGRTIHNFGYHVQAAFHAAGAVEMDLVAEDVQFVFVFQEKTEPYLVSVVDLDEQAQRIGYERLRRALEVYRDCSEIDVWPGHSTDIETVSLPRYAAYSHEMEAW